MLVRHVIYQNIQSILFCKIFLFFPKKKSFAMFSDKKDELKC